MQNEALKGLIKETVNRVCGKGGIAAPRFSQFTWLPQVAARGQVSHLPAASVPPLGIVVSRYAYAIPAVDGYCVAGATFSLDDDEMAERIEDLARPAAQPRRTA